MRITGLALLVAATQLSAATILPASWIEVYDYDSGAFSIQADDGWDFSPKLVKDLQTRVRDERIEDPMLAREILRE